MDQRTSHNPENNPGIMYKLGSIEAQLIAINDKLDTKELEQDNHIKEIRSDVTKLKEWRNYTLGAATVLSLIAGLAVKVLPIG